MSKISVFFLSLAAISLPLVVQAGQLTQKGSIEMASIGMEEKLVTCRALIAGHTQNNADVLAGFDIFASTLTQAYVAGESLIVDDVYRIIDGISFSSEKHQFQTRKNILKTPYIIHPIGVANNLMTIGKVRDADVIIAALLHDTVEDTDTTFDEIEKRFGVRVTDFVKEVTDDKSLAKDVRKRLQIEHAPHKSFGAAQVKLSDKLYNLSDMAKCPPEGWEPERLDAYFQWAQNVVDNLPWVNAPLKQAVDEVIVSYSKRPKTSG